MNAWLITWEGTSSNLNDGNRLVAILGSRRSDRYVSELVEFLYLRASSTASGMSYVANRPKQRSFKAEKRQLINNIPHGDRILCGHNPWLYARKVSALKVITKREKGVEELTWKEPPIFKWKNQRKMEIELEKAGEVKLLIRSSNNPVSNELKTFCV